MNKLFHLILTKLNLSKKIKPGKVDYLDVWASPCDGDGRIGFFALCEPPDRKSFSMAKPLEFEPVLRLFTPDVPFLTVGFEEAQKLMDGLWDCGLRPSKEDNKG